MVAVFLVQTEFTLILSLLIKITIGVGAFCVCAFLFMKKDLFALLSGANEMKDQKNGL